MLSTLQQYWYHFMFSKKAETFCLFYPDLFVVYDWLRQCIYPAYIYCVFRIGKDIFKKVFSTQYVI